jgi:methionyl-tRNA synthetase
MKTVVTEYEKHYPTITENKFKKIDSQFTAYISTTTPNRPFQKLASLGWRELRKDEDIFELAKTADVFYKTSSCSWYPRKYVAIDKDEARYESVDTNQQRLPF